MDAFDREAHAVRPRFRLRGFLFGRLAALRARRPPESEYSIRCGKVSALHRGSRNAATFARASGAAAALFSRLARRPRRPRRSSRLRGPRAQAPVDRDDPGALRPEGPGQGGRASTRINSDRAEAGLPAVAWDEAASRVADAFCEAQVAEGTRGHFLTDGDPALRPHRRSPASRAWARRTRWPGSRPLRPSRSRRSRSALAGTRGHDARDAARTTATARPSWIPRPRTSASGWSMKGGSFRMAQEFLNRKLASLRSTAKAGTLLVRGSTVSGYFAAVRHDRVGSGAREVSQGRSPFRGVYIYPTRASPWSPRAACPCGSWASIPNDHIRAGRRTGDFSVPLRAAAVGTVDDGLLRGGGAGAAAAGRSRGLLDRRGRRSDHDPRRRPGRGGPGGLRRLASLRSRS